ncbi:HlyD family efflux transporter periplasmic adaptor subunit [Chlorogloeopsis sp. ULAP01]|uniref:HlyD family efflux transporter periplasmic adaptor subunit n=1 Tax=Chlorogloeopsis sp. ULAP01 TaxID=3056483 RepID=UPI0025AAD6ED|nr:HlyD family efflux transporter periplasmic adaptor subunit [Chlorogloeopsis sp. ULAP01]MDM9383447.1 HlyD family efflux transporter periplasmic adaptor subunit [Chlorogloeopsis sp. ULAP01]
MNQINGTSSNGHYRNGNHANGAKLENTQVLTLTEITEIKASQPPLNTAKYQQEHNFEQSEIVLRQSPFWSRAIMLSLIGIASFGITWANFAKMEQVIPATGQLKPEGTVKEIQAPVNGVVKAVYIKDGQSVKPGDLLLIFDTTANNAELLSLKKIRASLFKENQIYLRLMNSTSDLADIIDLMQGKLPKEVEFLLKNRIALIAENELLRTEFKKGNAIGLAVDEKQRLEVSQRESYSRTQAARLAVEQIKKQLAQNQVKINQSEENLSIENQILSKMKNLAEEGAIAQLQYLQQQQNVQEIKAQIAQLNEEQQRLKFNIEQGQQEVNNTIAVIEKNILDKIAENNKHIAQIDSQFTKILLDNEKKLAEINSKISQTQQNLKYQEVRAPVNGTVFDLQAKSPGFVVNTTQNLLKIVPNESYVAEVFITNKDIGFIREGMKVDVRIDSFPYSEFGDIKGTISWVGSDALPPDNIHSYYRFPVKVRLESQSLDIKGKTLSLQSGMSISTNIKVREKRTVISLFTELFTKQIETLKEVR